jgi:hypothetical protein
VSLYERFCQLDRSAKGFISEDEFLSIPEFSLNPLSKVPYSHPSPVLCLPPGDKFSVSLICPILSLGNRLVANLKQNIKLRQKKTPYQLFTNYSIAKLF